MTYSAKANPNATNSELDSKRIITHKELTSAQRYELIEQFVELVVDNMDTKDLVMYVSDNLTEYYDDCSDVELKEYIDNYNEELYEELVDNVTQQYPKQNYNQGLWLQLLFLSHLLQREQEQVNGASILCVLIVNQSAKFITLVGQDYNALNVKNVLTNYSGA